MNLLTRSRIPVLLTASALAVLCVATVSVADNHIRRYNGGPLTKDDFQAPVPPPAQRNGLDAETATGTEFSHEGTVDVDPGGKVVYTPSSVSLRAVVDRDQSWNSDPDDKSLMDHETGHFDLQEQLARKAQAEVNRQRASGDLKGEGTTDEEAKADLESKVQQIIDQIDDAHQARYDDVTNHGKIAEAQAKQRAKQRQALQAPFRSEASQTGPQLDSRADQSLSFDAATGRLTLDGDFITGVHATDGSFVPDPSDPILGAEVLFPSFTLVGETFDGLFAFGAEGVDPMLTISDGVTIYYDARLDYLLYDPSSNKFLGLTKGFQASSGLSHFVDELILAGAQRRLALFGIELLPDLDFSAATAGFTVSADSPVTNGAGLRLLSIPEPGGLPLLVLGLLTLAGWRTLARSAWSRSPLPRAHSHTNQPKEGSLP